MRPFHQPPFRYSLRALLVGVAIAAMGVALWVRPYSVEVFRPDGTLLARYRVQRAWRGDPVACGVQEWFLPEGGCYRRQEAFGAILREGRLGVEGTFGSSVYPPHKPPDPPTEDYIYWLRHDDVPISTDLPRTAGPIFSYP